MRAAAQCLQAHLLPQSHTTAQLPLNAAFVCLAGRTTAQPPPNAAFVCRRANR
jgi:hypothetical protein